MTANSIVQPLAANQVRTRVNKRGIRTYYIVAEDHHQDYHCLWFRTRPEDPMMVISPDATYSPTVDDPVVLDNINLLTDTFTQIVEGVTEDKVEEEIVEEEKEEEEKGATVIPK